MLVTTYGIGGSKKDTVRLKLGHFSLPQQNKALGLRVRQGSKSKSSWSDLGERNEKHSRFCKIQIGHVVLTTFP